MAPPTALLALISLSLLASLSTAQCSQSGSQCTASTACCAPDAQCKPHPEAEKSEWLGPGFLNGNFCLKDTQCLLGGERCQGAPGRPRVPYRSCCSIHDECRAHPDAGSAPDTFWGSFCINKYPDLCHSTTARCEGEAGFPFVQSRSCCDRADSCIPHPGRGSDGNLWGNFCLPPGGKPSYPAVEKTTLLPGIFTADPSAHVFDGKLYVVTSVDDPIENTVDENEMHFLMTRYQIMSFNGDLSSVTNEWQVLPIETVPWAPKQLWAPDFTCKGNRCYLYFPAKDENDHFRIGVAVSDNGPTGPYKAESNYIQGTFSVDASVYDDEDGQSYLIWGGEWGGQLENWNDNVHFDSSAPRPTAGNALQPRIAKLKSNMVEIETTYNVRILDDNGNDVQVTDGKRKFFEAPWIHKRNGVHYLSYSTGETHLIAYARSTTGPQGPYRYGGTIMSPPIGWTSHQSIVAYNGVPYLFYHDSKTSGRTNLRQVKFQRLDYRSDGSIIEVTP